MEDWTQFIKSIIRPFIIIWGCVVYGLCILNEIEMPELLAALVAAVVIEYFGERAIKRFKEQK
jgi:hypothetical protein